MWTVLGMGSKKLSCFFPTQSRYSGASLRKTGAERIKQLKRKENGEGKKVKAGEKKRISTWRCILSIWCQVELKASSELLDSSKVVFKSSLYTKEIEWCLNSFRQGARVVFSVSPLQGIPVSQ